MPTTCASTRRTATRWPRSCGARSRSRSPIDIKYRDSAEAVSALARGECELAGFHLPLGEFRATCAQTYRRWLDPDRHQLIHLTRRTQGLFLPKGNPKGIEGLRDLARERHAFRQSSARFRHAHAARFVAEKDRRRSGPDQRLRDDGTHALGDRRVRRERHGRSRLRRAARGAAFRARLHSRSSTRTIFSHANARGWKKGGSADIIEILKSDAFKDSVAHLEGYDPARCGELVGVEKGLSGA